MPERCLACQRDINEERRFKCFSCNKWFCLSCIVKHSSCKEPDRPDGTIEFPGPSMMERVEIMYERVNEMCSKAEAFIERGERVPTPKDATFKDIMPRYKWKEIGRDWIECKRHQERFASDTICTRCVEDIIAGGL